MSAETRAILTNREVIAVNQDTLGVQGRRVRADGRDRSLGEEARWQRARGDPFQPEHKRKNGRGLVD